jgi:hypothetical protein
MSPICDCNAMDEAAAAFSSNSGDRTLEYLFIGTPLFSLL